MICGACPFDHGSAVAWARRVASDICLMRFCILPQLPPITTATSTQEPARAAGGARAVSEAIDRIGLLGSRYLSKRLQNENKQPIVMLEKEMAPYSSILAWKILWTEEPGGLLSTGSHRVRQD